MEPNKLDNYFKKVIGNSEDHYREYSDKAKNYIWRKIQGKNLYVVPIRWQRLAVAASILILFSLSIYLYINGRSKAAVIENLYSAVDSLQHQLKNQTSVASFAGSSDEQKIKEVIVKVPVASKEVVEKIKYIKDTVFIKQIITEYKNPADDSVQNQDTKPLLTNNDTSPVLPENKSAVSQAEYIFANGTKTKKKVREKLFKIRYGSGKYSDSQTNSFSITAEL